MQLRFILSRTPLKRLLSWFPFTMHIGINGREWLAEQLKRGKIDYVKVDNCFTSIDDFPKAQKLLNAQVRQQCERQGSPTSVANPPP